MRGAHGPISDGDGRHAVLPRPSAPAGASSSPVIIGLARQPLGSPGSWTYPVGSVSISRLSLKRPCLKGIRANFPSPFPLEEPSGAARRGPSARVAMAHTTHVHHARHDQEAREYQARRYTQKRQPRTMPNTTRFSQMAWPATGRAKWRVGTSSDAKSFPRRYSTRRERGQTDVQHNERNIHISHNVSPAVTTVVTVSSPRKWTRHAAQSHRQRWTGSPSPVPRHTNPSPPPASSQRTTSLSSPKLPTSQSGHTTLHTESPDEYRSQHRNRCRTWTILHQRRYLTTV